MATAAVARPRRLGSSRAWRYAVATGPYALAAATGLILAVNDVYAGAAPVVVPVGLATLAALSLRHRWPPAVALGCALATILSSVALGPLVVAVASLATRRGPREISLLVAALAGLTWFGPAIDPAHPFFARANLGTDIVCVAAAMTLGRYVGARRDLIAQLQQRAQQAEAEQVGLAERARQAERARIAREMHDVLAHRVSRVAMHAGVLAYRDDLSREQVRESAAHIQADAHAALIELREVLGVLRDPRGARLVSTPRPQPTWADIGELVLDAGAGGQRVSLRDEVQHPEHISALLGRTAYRIVQESITNAGKHAPAARVEVALSADGSDALHVWVRNLLPVGSAPNPPPGSGLGLIGVAERVALLRGCMTYGVIDRQFVVHATLPLAGSDG